MKKLFQKAIEWLRSRVTGIKSEKLRVKSEKVEASQSVCQNDDLSMVKGERLKVKEETLNPKPSTLNQAKLRLTIPDIEALLREKYELRYNVLTEQSEYRMKEGGAAFAAVTQRVYKTWMADLQADGYNVWWAEGVRIAAESMHIVPYHPVTHYFSTLPEWDGEDRLRPLMSRLTSDETMVGYLCRWLLALVAQAQGRDDALYAIYRPEMLVP